MGAKLGNANRLYLKSTSSYVWVGGEQNNTNNRTAEAINTSDKSSEYNTYISGSKDGNISATIFQDDSNDAQKAAFAAFKAGDVVDWFVGEIGENNLPRSGEAGKGIITSISDTNNRGEVASRSLEIQKSGAPTFYPAS